MEMNAFCHSVVYPLGCLNFSLMHPSFSYDKDRGEVKHLWSFSWIKSFRWPVYWHAGADVTWTKGISAGKVAPSEEKSLYRLPVHLCFQPETEERKALSLQEIVGHWLAAETDGAAFPAKPCRLPTASAPSGALDHMRCTLTTCQRAVQPVLRTTFRAHATRELL